MITFFTNKMASRFTAVILLFCLSSFSFNASAFGEIVVPAGTKVELETVQTVSSELIQPGETIDFKVVADVMVDGIVVIKAGSIAKGTVSSSSKAKGLGKEGSIEVRVKSVPGVDGKLIPLSSNSITRTGDDQAILSIVLGVFICLLFLLLKGKNGIIPSGTAVDAVVGSNTRVTV